MENGSQSSPPFLGKSMCSHQLGEGQAMSNELTPFWSLLIYLLINMMQYVE